MGLLKVGTPKKWDDSKKDLRYIRNAGVHQFLSTYKRVKDFKGDDLLWGDEVEYGIFNIDNSHLRLALRGKEIMDQLNKQEVREYLQKGRRAVPQHNVSTNAMQSSGRHCISPRFARPRRPTTSPETRAAIGSPNTGLGWSRLRPPGPTPATPMTYFEWSAT